MSPKSRWANPYRLAALVVLLGSGVALTYGYRLWSMIGVGFSVGLTRRAQGYSSSPPATLKDSVSYVPPLKRPGWRLWIAVGVSSVLVVLSYLTLRRDVLHGGQQAWPVYAFAAAILVTPFVCWRLVQRLRGGP